MKNYLIALSLLAGLAFVGGGIEPEPGHAATVQLKPCPTEDTGLAHTRCVWDARHRTNGQGRSFIRRSDLWVAKHGEAGSIRYVSHTKAHALTH